MTDTHLRIPRSEAYHWPSSLIGPVPGMTLSEQEVDALYGLPSMSNNWRRIVLCGSTIDWAEERLEEGCCGEIFTEPTADTDIDIDVEIDEVDPDLARIYDRLDLLAMFHPEKASAVRAFYLDQVTQGELAKQLGISQPSVCARIKSGVEWMRSLSDEAVEFLRLDDVQRRSIVSLDIDRTPVVEAIVAYTGGKSQVESTGNGRCSQPALSGWIRRLISDSTHIGLSDALKSLLYS